MPKNSSVIANQQANGGEQASEGQEGAVTDPALAVDETQQLPENNEAAEFQEGEDVKAGEGEQGGEQPGEDETTHVHAPYGFRADGMPRVKPGRPSSKEPVDIAAKQERDKQRARLRSVTPGQGAPAKKIPIAITPLAVVNYEAMGQAVASMWFMGGQMVFGDEWAPDTKEGEHTAVAGAFAQYFKSVQAKDLPPGVALCFVLGIYTLKRATRPTIKTKFAVIGAWLKSKMAFGRKGMRIDGSAS